VTTNNIQSSMKVLEALIAGNDPETGKPLPHDSALNRADVLRALIGGLGALQETYARAQRRSQLPTNVGRSWSADEEQELIDAFQSKEPLANIAARHGRTLRAIEARLERKGLLTPEDRVTNNSFAGTNKKSK